MKKYGKPLFKTDTIIFSLKKSLFGIYLKGAKMSVTTIEFVFEL